MRLSCSAVDGNPLPSLQWYRNGEPHFHEFKTDERNSRVWSELLITISPSDNNASYKCDAKNAAISEPLTAQVKLEVKCKWLLNPYLYDNMSNITVE